MPCTVWHGGKRKNADELIVRINKLLEQYQQLLWVTQPLEEYMRECDRHYKACAHPGMKKYQDAFQRIRLLDSKNTGNVTQLFTNLITIGEVNGVEGYS